MGKAGRDCFRLAIEIATGALPILVLACGRTIPAPGHDASVLSGTGGNVGATGGAFVSTLPLGTGGASGSGGAGMGGVRRVAGGGDSGGEPGVGGTFAGRGGDPGTGGGVGIGGSLGSGGGTSGSTGTGGSSGTGGATASGGATVDGGAMAHPPYPPAFVGNTDSKGLVRSDFATYWEQLTPEYAGKWYAVQKAADTFDWSTLDALYAYAEDHHLVFKEHCFIWGSSVGGWWTTLNADTAPAAVQNWMTAFCDRYPKTRLIDVVNEPPPHTTPKFVNAIGGGTNTTWDWVANSFKWARAACPNAVLILNDYDNCEFTADAKHSAEIVKAIQMLDAPIDAVGCQTHGASTLPASTLEKNIALIASSTGLPVYITEYDIGLADDEQQKLRYQDHIAMFRSNPNVKGITLWGYIVGETWRNNTGIMASDGTMRPAMTWLMDYLGR
jgi:endo-1,4-beta-xylanase